MTRYAFAGRDGEEEATADDEELEDEEGEEDEDDVNRACCVAGLLEELLGLKVDLEIRQAHAVHTVS